MSDALRLAGSFALTWFACWLLLLALLLALRPLLRPVLLRLHPAAGSLLMLLALCVPVLLSLLLSVLLFVPQTEAALVDVHCHVACSAHLPLLSSLPVSVAGVLLFVGGALVLLRRLLGNLGIAARLQSQLAPLSERRGAWHLLDREEPFVFTLGWWKSRIYITQGLYRQCGEADLGVILAHEQAHAGRLDNLRLLLARLCLLPLPSRWAKPLYADLHLLCEAACDYAAAEGRSTLAVAESLLRVQKLVPARLSFGGHCLLSAFTGGETELRIRLLLEDRVTSRWQSVLPLLCLSLLLLSSLALVGPLHHWMESLWALH